MKSKHIISLLFIVIAMFVTAQSKTDAKAKSAKSKTRNASFFKLGLKAGLDMYPLTYNPEEIINQIQNGYQFGASLQMGYSFYLQPEVYYAIYPELANGISSEKTPGIRAPLLIGVRFLNLKILSLHLMGGPVLYASLSDLQQEFILANFTYNWQVGAGIKFLEFLSVDLRYQIIRKTDLLEQFKNIPNSPLNVIVGIRL